MVPGSICVQAAPGAPFTQSSKSNLLQLSHCWHGPERGGNSCRSLQQKVREGKKLVQSWPRLEQQWQTANSSLGAGLGWGINHPYPLFHQV